MSAPERREPPALGAFMVVAIILLALNLRMAVNSLGSVMPELARDTGLSGTTGGVLLALPPLAFACFGLSAPRLATRLGMARAVVVACALMIVGQLLRVLVEGIPAIFAGTILALAGAAIANVIMPGLVFRYFPRRLALMTALYVATLTIGGSFAAGAAVPFERAVGADWRTGLGMWVVFALVALIPWVAVMVRERASSTPSPQTIPLGRMLRSPLAWTMASYFGLQGLQAFVLFGWLPTIFVDAGISPEEAGIQLALLTATGIPFALVLPWWMSRGARLRPLMTALIGANILGYLGLVLAPAAAPSLWSILLGAGTGTFTLALTLIALRARTAEGTNALSAFTQSIGYLIAAAGPAAVGAMRDWTAGWTLPLSCVIAILVLQLVLGFRAARPGVVEDDLASP